jgi:CDP-paratose 2-epimerase
MSTIIVTGSGGLIGSQAVTHFASEADVIVGIDNNMRQEFFGEEASTDWVVNDLSSRLDNYRHVAIDIRDNDAIQKLFAEYSSDISLVVHTAAQPSHDWAARDPHTDFSVNANGTLNLLEATRQHAPDAVFIFTSTNKVYGDTPNKLPLIELEKRWELDPEHPWAEHGIPEEMSVDQSTHSLFGASKLAADALVQEYGRYFDMKTAAFRGGCLSGAELHGFLAYLVKCTVIGRPYTVFGYKAKQVRDNIHASDLISAFDHFYRAPRVAEVYNIGGGRAINCSMLEAIEISEQLSGKKLDFTYSDENRIGDHIWYVSDVRRFQNHYPDWKFTYDLQAIMAEIHDKMAERWLAEGADA